MKISINIAMIKKFKNNKTKDTHMVKWAVTETEKVIINTMIKRVL